jgi:hypothetical protein
LNGKANTALSNLASVAINTHLLPGTTSVYDIGSNTYKWKDVYVSNRIYSGGGLYYTGSTGGFINVTPGSAGIYFGATDEDAGIFSWSGRYNFKVPAVASLPASTTTVVSALSYDPSAYAGCELHYVIRSTDTGYNRTGVIYVANNLDGSGVSYTDTYAETAVIGITSSVALDSGSIKFSFNNAEGSNYQITARQDLMSF